MGVVWLLLQSVGVRVIAFGSQIVLAWLLLAEDFGIYALALTVTSVASVLASSGVDDVLTQRQQTIRFWVTASFWVSLGMSTLSMAVVLAAAPVMAAVYGTPELLVMLSIMAVALPLGGLATVPMAMIRASLRFRFLAGYTTAELAITQLLTVLLAWWGMGAFSFIIPVPVMAAARAVIFWRMSPPPLRRGLRLSQVKYVVSSGMAVLGLRVITTASEQFGAVMLGLTATPAAVGTYYFAYRLTVQPITMLAGSFSGVLLPALSRLRQDAPRQHHAAVEAAHVLAFAATPLCVLQAALAEPALHVVFGPRWEAAIPLVQILSLGFAFNAVSWVAGALLGARGDFRLAFLYACINAVPFFAAVVLGAMLGADKGVTLAVAGIHLTALPIYSYVVFRRGGIPFRRVMGLFAVPTVLSFAAVGGAYAVSLLPLWRGQDLIRIAVLLLGSGVLYPVLIRMAVPSAYHQLTSRLREFLRLG
jgi:PST family polysaccharide transporter